MSILQSIHQSIKACSPGYLTPGESTHNRTVTLTLNRRHPNCRREIRWKSPMPDSGAGLRSRSVYLRHRGPQQPPQGPAWPRGNYLPDVRAFPLCRQDCYYCCQIRAGVPNIYSRIYLGTLDSVVYWVTLSVGNTI